MQCPRENGSSAELLIAYAAGALEASAQIEFERHMAVCDGCRNLAAEQKAVWDALDDWRPAPVSADFNQKLYERISQEAAIRWWERPFHLDFLWAFRPAVPVAAACAAVMAVFLIMQPLTTHPTPAPAEQKVSIEQVERALDDMDMLKQMSLTAPVEGQATERI